MRNRPKRFGLNDYNLGDCKEGERRRGTLEAGDGLLIPRGFLPSAVKLKLLGRNVRFALDWRLDEPAHRTLRKFYLATHMPATIPFGWVRLYRVLGPEAYEISPLWVVLPELIREWWWNARMWLMVRAERAGALEFRRGEFVWWPAQDWGP